MFFSDFCLYLYVCVCVGCTHGCIEHQSRTYYRLSSAAASRWSVTAGPVAWTPQGDQLQPDQSAGRLKVISYIVASRLGALSNQLQRDQLPGRLKVISYNWSSRLGAWRWLVTGRTNRMGSRRWSVTAGRVALTPEGNQLESGQSPGRLTVIRYRPDQSSCWVLRPRRELLVFQALHCAVTTHSTVQCPGTTLRSD